MRAFIRSHTTKALRDSIRSVRGEWAIWRRHRVGLQLVPKFLNHVPLKLHLGCGPNRKAGWINIDLFHEEADLALDLRGPWPFPAESVMHIYSEHVFEHFEHDHEVPHFLSESIRVLRPGGIFDVGVPDTAWPLTAYGNAQDPYWSLAKSQHPQDCETPMDHLNYHFRQGNEHKYAWDEETLTRSLLVHGFINVKRREFDSALDCDTRRAGTLYMTGSKPL